MTKTSPLLSLFDCWRNSRTDVSTEESSSIDAWELSLYFPVPDSSPEISICMRRNNAISLSLFKDLLSDDVRVLNSSSLNALLTILFFEVGLSPLLVAQTLVLEFLSWNGSVLQDATGSNLHTVSAKYNRLHQKMMTQFLVPNMHCTIKPQATMTNWILYN